MKYRGCLVAAAVASVLALCGCVAWKPHPVPRATPQEIAELRDLQLDLNWETSGLGVDAAGQAVVDHPDVAVVRTIEPGEWSTVMAECMNGAGFESYHAAGEGLASTVSPPELHDAEAYAKYVCQSQYPYGASVYGHFGAAQLEYLYDYYTRWLIPCLGWQGYEVTDVPDRATFLATEFGAWAPYNSPVFAALPRGAATEKLQAACAPLPEGFAD